MNLADCRPHAAVEVTLRIPGTWRRPEDFYEQLPTGCRATERGLVIADGSEFEMYVLPADADFPEVFASSCNSGLAHGATDWRTLLGDAEGGGLYWAFVSTVRGDDELYSMGMHILGFRDAIVPVTGVDEFDYRTLHSFLGYTAFSGANLKDGDAIGDPVLPNFRIYAQADDRTPPEAPMHNPFGRWRLEPIDGSRN